MNASAARISRTLERRQRLAELHPLRRVRRRVLDRGLAHPELQRAQAEQRAVDHRGQRLRAPSATSPNISAGAPLERQVRVDLAVRGDRTLERSRRGRSGRRGTQPTPSGVAAGTSTRAATCAAGTDGLNPSSRQPPSPWAPSARRPNLRRQRIVHAGLGQRRGEHRRHQTPRPAATPPAAPPCPRPRWSTPRTRLSPTAAPAPPHGPAA